VSFVVFVPIIMSGFTCFAINTDSNSLLTYMALKRNISRCRVHITTNEVRRVKQILQRGSLA